MGGTNGTHGKYEKFIQYFGRKTERKISHFRPRPRWEDNIKMNSKATGCVGIDFIKVALEGVQWQALVNTGMKRLVA
jgi:hypothetical protein